MRRFVKGDPGAQHWLDGRLDCAETRSKEKRLTRSISPGCLPTLPIGSRASVTSWGKNRGRRTSYLLSLRGRLDLRAGGSSLSEHDGIIWGRDLGYPLPDDV